MDLLVGLEAQRVTTRALFDHLREAIASGRLRDGDRLPPSRELAAELGVSRTTITTVYGRLSAEGFTVGRAGGGTAVAVDRVDAPLRRRPEALRPRVRSLGDVPLESLDDAAWSPRFDLRTGVPDPALFPLADWRRCVTTALQRPPGGYGSPAGSEPLRRALAHWIGRSRAVDASPHQVIVTSGAQQAVDLATRVLVRPGDVVAVEDPGYPPMPRLFHAHGARVHPVPVDAEGIVVDAIPTKARLVYTTPSHQAPTGVTMSLTRRKTLLAFADRHDVAILEDDYDSEYRHVDRPLEPLYRLDRSGRVIYVATFSKTLSPAMRLGFAVMPESLVDAAVRLRKLMDGQPPGTTEEALLHFVVDGHLDRHLRRARKVYTQRHQLVTRFVAELASDGVVLPKAPDNAGLHVMAHLAAGATEHAVRAAARRRGIALGNLAEWWIRPAPPEGIVIGFGATPTRDLPEALALLGEALREGRRARGASAAGLLIGTLTTPPSSMGQ